MEGWLILLGGLLGSSHCIGMCGGFALSIGAGAQCWTENLRRQLLYSCGRIFTYAAIGAASGYVGLRLTRVIPPLVNVQATLALVAGSLLVFQGLKSMGLVRWPSLANRTFGCLGPRFFGSFLQARGWSQMFFAGLLTGFLPCGLVYAYLALAASTGTMFEGMAYMAWFGAGTVPAMVLVGCGSSLVSVTTRHHLFRLAAWCVLLTGLLAIARGATSLRSTTPEEACPFCQKKAVASSAPLPSESMFSGRAK